MSLGRTLKSFGEQSEVPVDAKHHFSAEHRGEVAT
jgi:hypothetical protein